MSRLPSGPVVYPSDPTSGTGQHTGGLCCGVGGPVVDQEALLVPLGLSSHQWINRPGNRKWGKRRQESIQGLNIYLEFGIVLGSIKFQ